MLHRFALYGFSLGVLVAVCLIYEYTFVAWVEPPPLPPIQMASSPVLRPDDSLASLFPEGSWQRGNCKRLQTRDGVLLFENWQQMSDDQWKLWPLAVVIGSKGSSPLILEAIEGAEIKFTESLDVMSGGAPPIERGRMIGQVTIRNFDRESASEPGRAVASKSRRIQIEASEVGIDHKKVWTTEPIRLQLGDAVIAGRDLTLHLATGGGIASVGENALSVLDRLELIYLDELSMPLAEGGLWGNKQTDPVAMPTGQPGRPVPIMKPSLSKPVLAGPGMLTLRCGGRVVFQFASGELTLQDHVELRHAAYANSQAIDTFVCEQLQLRFTDLMAKREKTDQLKDYLLSMIAIGRPARASIASFGADLAAGQIELDTRANIIRLGGPAGVLFSYAGTRWRFGQVTYRIHPTDPKQFGSFDAIGAGGMDVAETINSPVSRLRWSSGVKLEQSDLDDDLSLRFDGDVEAAMSDGGSFRCDFARFWLQKQTVAPEDDDDSGTSMRWLPKQFQATGKVELKTLALSVATNLLQIYFENEPTNVSATTNPSPPASLFSSMIKQPVDDQPTNQLVGSSTPIKAARPTVFGNTINATLRLAGGEMSAKELIVVGDVTMRHEVPTAGGILPAILTGDRLMLNNTDGNDILQLSSGIDRPARFDLGDGFFIGPLIQVRLSDNVVWIKDAGEFQLPTQVLPRIGALVASAGIEPIDPSPPAPNVDGGIQWIDAPKCRWQGQMWFDGRTAMLTDGVDIHATIIAGKDRDVWDLQLTGDQMQLVLSQDVSVREVESVKAATVEQVIVTSSVPHPLLVTANQLTSAGLRKARHILAAPQLTFRPQTGALLGTGPGWYRAWVEQKPESQYAQLTVAPESSKFGLHLAYEKSLEVDLNRKQLDFMQRVRVAGKRVQSWDEVIDATQMQGLRLGESTLDCDRLRLAVDTTHPQSATTVAWEMEAIDNVIFQTRVERGLYSGTADRASYAAAKDIFLIEASPGRSAVLNETLPTGQPGLSVSGTRMIANPKTMELQNFEFDRLQLGVLPGNGPGNGPGKLGR